jgi:hypothetical protein
MAAVLTRAYRQPAEVRQSRRSRLTGPTQLLPAFVEAQGVSHQDPRLVVVVVIIVVFDSRLAGLARKFVEAVCPGRKRRE